MKIQTIQRQFFIELSLNQKQTKKKAFFLVMLSFLHYKKPYNLQINSLNICQQMS